MPPHDVHRFPAMDFRQLNRQAPSPETVRWKTSRDEGSVDAARLARALEASIRGEVRFDDGSRALYATDASNYRQVPIGVVVPKDEDDVVTAVALARQHGAPILARGGGTSLCGQCCNIAVVLDFSKYMNRILELNAEEKYAWVQPGIILDDLRNAAEKHTLTFGPDPATHTHCTLGGMIGNNSCGVHALMAGKTDDNIDELEILLYDGTRMRVGKTSDEELEAIIAEGGRRGEIYAQLRALRDRYADQIRSTFPDIPRRVSGYNLPYLLPENGFHVAKALVGSECTCIVVLRAKTRLVYSPPERTLVVLGYPDVFEAADHVTQILKFKPIGLEGIDDRLVSDMKAKGLNTEDLPLLPKGSGWLLCEFGGRTREEADGNAKKMMEGLKDEQNAPSMKLYDDKKEELLVWKIRESGLGATANVPGRPLTWEGWEDSAVAPEKLGGYLRDLRKLLDSYKYHGDLYGHFGQGCVHTRISFDLESGPGVAKFRRFLDEAGDLVVSYGGSISGEHGDGQSKAVLLPKMFGPELIGAFREFKAIWDPDGRMNPGKIVDPYDPTENLRLGPDYRPWNPDTHFQFPDDEGSFSRAVLRCVGVGECRRMDKGTMCPSFMATREEEHSTRGRTHLLFEMFEGKVIPADWKNESVKEALDLCLACKGCKGDCPVNVDMATYKAEFLAHYYKGKLRPPSAYGMGLIHWWARAASLAPDLANLMLGLPMAKTLGGIAPQRSMPQFARETFRARFARRSARRGTKGRVLLWPDTFNDHFHPETAEAAADVLEWAGYEVVTPPKKLCCGRPLYDFGFLGEAKRLLREILDVLGPEIDAGTPIIGLEPSCISVFRDELRNLFPSDPAAKRLASSAVMLSEFIDREGDRFPMPKLERKALTHGHCHHKSIMKMEPEERVLRKLGLDVDMPDSGCCGMAGAFGFEKDHYDVSIRVGERVLLPAVRQAARDTIVIADGFSCREQIEQTTDRQALHLAQVLKMAIDDGPHGPAGPYPETRYVESKGRPDLARALAFPVAVVAGAGLIAGGLWISRRWRGRTKR